MKARNTGRSGVFGQLGLALFLAVQACASDGLNQETHRPGSGLLKYEEPKFLAGAIYARDSRRLLFNFKRVAERSGANLKVQRDFTYPDGKLAARERVVYEGDSLVSYELEEAQIGARGSAKIRHDANKVGAGTIQFDYSKGPGSRSKEDAEPLRDNTLVTDMVGPFLLSQWGALERGEKLKCRLIVVPRVETVRFTFVKESEAVQANQQVLVVKMDPTSPFISALVDPLYFTIEKSPPHRVLQYVGRTTPKILAGGKWKDLDATTVFDWSSAR